MSIDINEKTPSTEDPPPQPERIWLNHLAEIEGYLSLMIVLWLFTRPQLTSRYPDVSSQVFAVVVLALSLGLALGSVRFGYSWGKYIGWLVLIWDGICVLLLVYLNAHQLLS